MDCIPTLKENASGEYMAQKNASDKCTVENIFPMNMW
jgi:hypothetical protein